MFNNLTLTQKLFIAFSLPLIIVIINSLMALIQLQNYHRMVEYEIVNVQDSDSIKEGLGQILDKSDKIARNAKMSIILVSTISVIMVIIMAVFIVRSLKLQSEGGEFVD